MVTRSTRSTGLTGPEIQRIVHRYIGVTSDGYLIGFSYSKVAQFFSLYCGVDPDPDDLQGTSVERFSRVFAHASPEGQVRILKGLLERIPSPTAEGTHVMTVKEVRRMIDALEGLPVPTVRPLSAKQAVERALSDSETLIKEQGAVSAVDRVHTALHGYLRGLCDDVSITYDEKDTAQRLLRLLADSHPALQVLDSKVDVSKILGPMGGILETVNAARNTRSLAHPNDVLIREPEAMLAINAVRTIMYYLNEKTQ